jgi:hypothetical protein
MLFRWVYTVHDYAVHVLGNLLTRMMPPAGAGRRRAGPRAADSSRITVIPVFDPQIRSPQRLEFGPQC